MASNERDEENPLLTNIPDKTQDDSSIKKKPCWTRVHYVLFLLHAAFLAVNAGLLAFNMASDMHSTCSASSSPVEVEDLYSPAQVMMKHEIRIPHTAPGGLFTGLPRRELDEAWSDLLRPSMIDMPAEEMRKMNKSSIAIRDTGGYVAYYGVFHQLHCLKRMYQWNYREHYQDLIDAKRMTGEHFDHCLEVLRTQIMCKPDLTVNTVHFDPEAPTGIKGFNQHERKYVKWDSFKEWVDQKAIPAPLEAYVVRENEVGNFGP